MPTTIYAVINWSAFVGCLVAFFSIIIYVSLTLFPHLFPRAKECPTVQHFTFALTDVEGKQHFGFCRLAIGFRACLCLLRYKGLLLGRTLKLVLFRSPLELLERCENTLLVQWEEKVHWKCSNRDTPDLSFQSSSWMDVLAVFTQYC